MRIKFVNPKTGMVLNLHTTASGTAVANGTRFSLYPDTGSADQIFEFDPGDTVIMRLLRNPAYVLNRHSKSNLAIAWPLASSTPADMRVNTETENGNARLKLVEHDLYLTAASAAKGAEVYWKPKADDALQYWRLDEAGAGSSASGVALPLERVSQQSFTAYSKTFRNQACLATCLLIVARYFGHNITMDTLTAAGCVNKASAFVNHTGGYFVWTTSNAGASEVVYCKAIAAALDNGQPVVIKMTGGSSDHFIVATGYTSATAAGITVVDPTDGAARSLKEAYSKHNKKYVHIRVCTRG